MSLQLKGALAAGFDAFRPQFPFENVQGKFAWEQPLLIPLVVFAVHGHSVGFFGRWAASFISRESFSTR